MSTLQAINHITVAVSTCYILHFVYREKLLCKLHLFLEVTLFVWGYFVMHNLRHANFVTGPVGCVTYLIVDCDYDHLGLWVRTEQQIQIGKLRKKRCQLCA